MTRRSRRHSLLARRQRGQALILVALVLPFLVILLTSAVEVATRLLERAELEDALRQASRSAIQTFDYGPFAQATTRTRPADLLLVARTVFEINVASVHGLKTSPAATAAAVQWELVPDGGTSCQAPNGLTVAVTAPALCATLSAQMEGFLGWGEWRPTVFVVETLDQVR